MLAPLGLVLSVSCFNLGMASSTRKLFRIEALRFGGRGEGGGFNPQCSFGVLPNPQPSSASCAS